MKLPKTSEEKIIGLKNEGWELKSINQIYVNNEVDEVKVVFGNKDGKYVTINTKMRTMYLSEPLPFKDIYHFSEIALEGGFDIEN